MFITHHHWSREYTNTENGTMRNHEHNEISDVQNLFRDNNFTSVENTPESDAVLNDSYNNSEQLNISDHFNRTQDMETETQDQRNRTINQDISQDLNSDFSLDIGASDFLNSEFSQPIYPVTESNHILHQFQKKYNLKPRRPTTMPKSLIIIGGQSPKAVNRVEYLNLQNDVHELGWEHGKIPRLPYRCCRAGVAQHVARDNEIYVVGGFSGSHRLRTAMRFGWEHQRWETLPFQMKSRRSTCAAAILDDKLYAIGGFDGGQGLSSCEVLNLKDSKGWFEISSLL